MVEAFTLVLLCGDGILLLTEDSSDLWSDIYAYSAVRRTRSLENHAIGIAANPPPWVRAGA